MSPVRRAPRDRPASRKDPLPRGRRGQADRLRPWLPGRRPALGRGRRPSLRSLPLPRPRLADRRPADRDEARRRPLPLGIAALISSFLEALDLEDVTIVGNDSGGAMSQVLVTRHPERIGRLVLTNCDTHENFPPGALQGDAAARRLPGGMAVSLAAPFRIGAVARAAFRPFTKDPIPPELIASWMEPGLHDPGVKRDLKKVTRGMNKRYTLEAAEKLRGSELPILLTWAPGDRFFPLEVRAAAGSRSGQRPDRRDPRLEDVRADRPAAAPRRRDRRLRRLAAR